MVKDIKPYTDLLSMMDKESKNMPHGEERDTVEESITDARVRLAAKEYGGQHGFGANLKRACRLVLDSAFPKEDESPEEMRAKLAKKEAAINKAKAAIARAEAKAAALAKQVTSVTDPTGASTPQTTTTRVVAHV